MVNPRHCASFGRLSKKRITFLLLVLLSLWSVGACSFKDLGYLTDTADDAGAACHNGRLDGAETDIDCGGGACAACALGGKCKAGGDCQNRECTKGICRPASCANE